MNITSNEIRQKYIEFFQSKQHAIIPSSPLVPENDPTVLFNTAGMQPLVPYLLGEKHPLGKRLADYQKCIRTNDIEEVGDDTHLTFFEMLGNWSLGDYFKKESIAWSWEFLTSPKWMGIDPKKIAVTVFEGDENAPRDEESVEIWRSLGMNNISYLGKKDNWWAAGDTGPCGPDTEIFYWVGKTEFPPNGSTVENDDKNWMEIWNNVFMEFNKGTDGVLVKLPAQNVDTGMGLERITRTLNGASSVYETDIFSDIIETICSTLGVEYSEKTQTSVRIIADHTRASVMMMADGVLPSNVDQGYILRRLMRRAIRQGYKLRGEGQFLRNVADRVIEKFLNIYPNVGQKREYILEEIEKEEKQFLQTLEKGLKEFDKLVQGFQIAFEKTGVKVETISGEKAFKLYDTFGFPIEMTQELAKERGLQVDENGFQESYKKHQALSRLGSEQKFKGGLADTSDLTTALHSATHLMLSGLRKVLGTHVHQAGSNITSERLRFDFTHGEKMTENELKEVENWVNQVISKNAKMFLEEIPKTQAEQDQTIEASFWEKYPEMVKVYTFKSDSGEIFSRELCGGPHVENTGNMGKFKILKEEASSRGVRRIKAILEK